MRKGSVSNAMIWVFSIILSILLISCGGGGSSGSDSQDTGTGTVSVYLADAPSDDYDSVVLYVKKAMLMPPDSEPNSKIATVFESSDPDGHPVDLLQYRFQDFLLTVNEDVAAGYYSKIRLVVTKVEATGGPCEDNIKLPSGKIDLVLKEAVHVTPATPLALRLDVDVDKSFDLHVAGDSGMCIFRPVIFVEKTSLPQFSKCPRLVKGTIEELLYENEVLSGFVLALDRHRGEIEVGVASNTFIFDKDGSAVEPEALSIDQFVHLKGPVGADGKIDALMIVMGNVLDVSGTAESGVDAEGYFELKLAPSQALVGDTIMVRADQALIMTGCEEIADGTAIVPWAKIDVVGKLDLESDMFLATAVLVDSPRIQGELVSIVESVQGYGYDLGIVPDGSTDTETVFLPDADMIYLGHDGSISIDLLQNRLDCIDPLFVSAMLVNNPDYLEAGRVTVKPDRVTGVVRSVESENTIVTIEMVDDEGMSIKLQVLDDSKIIRNGQNGDEYVTVNAIKEDDRITAFGLFDCSIYATADFVASVIFLQPNDIPVFQLPEVITENDERFMLPAGLYDQTLTVNGNSFTLIGNDFDSCEGEGLTIISGDVVINGNDARFENIKFGGTVIENGNGAQFINCCSYK